MISFLWNFGDGNISTDPNPTHAYKTPGKYEVTLRVGYANNNFLEDKVEVTITD
jgi:PKD repeat protein